MAYTTGMPTDRLSGIHQDLFVPGVQKEFYEEYIRTTPLYHLMSNRMDAPIHRHKLSDGEGLSFRVGRLQALDYKNPVLGTDQRRGKQMQQVMDYDQVDTVFRSFLVQAEARDIVRLGTKIDISDKMKSQLVKNCAQNLNWEIFKSATIDLYPNPATQKPVFDRIHISGVGLGENIGVTRVAYNGYAGLGEAWNTMIAGNQYDQNGLSLETLNRLKIMADQGGREPDKEAKLEPAWTKTYKHAYENDYYYFADPETLTQLFKDPDFKETTIARGVILPEQPQIISGADYIGKLRGLHIYSVPDLVEFRQKSENGNFDIAWNLLIAAGALTVGWYQYPFLVSEFDQFERTQTVAIHEYRGQKALRFPGKQNPNQLVEQGIIHSFVRLDHQP